MKQTRLLKTLLAAVCLFVGTSSVWGQASYNHSYTVSDGVTIDAAAGQGYGYFLYNVGAGKFFTGGRAWGAYATADHAGKLVEFIASSTNYKIHNRHVSANNVSNFEGYLPASLWADNNNETAENQTWTFAKVGDENKYTIYSTSQKKYLYYGTNTELSLGETADNDNYYWIIVPKTVRDAAGDYTYYIQNQGFNRPWEKPVWNDIYDDSNSANNKPAFPIFAMNWDATNPCAEKYHTVFNLYQNISETVPNGKYKVYAQAFYRQDDNGTGPAPTLYANSDNQNLAVLNGNGEGTTESMDGASAAFTAGQYVNQVTTVVTNGALKVGIDITQADQWVIWDNFVIDYVDPWISAIAEEFTNGGTMTTDKWYYYTVPLGTKYTITAGSELDNIIYTTNGDQLKSEADEITGHFSASQALTAGRVYIKSSSEQTLTFTEDAVAAAIADCKAWETSDEFATYIDGGSYASKEEVYAAHTAWQVENGTASKAILNNTVTSADHFWGNVTEGANYAGAPDTKYLAWSDAEYNVNQIVYQLPVGVYRSSAWTYSSTEASRKIYVAKVPVSGSWTDLINPATSTQGWVKLSGEFTLTEPANIAFGLFADGVNGRTAGIDNWTLTKIETISATITSAGWATLYSPYALNFYGTGLKAYTATLEGTKVTLTPVENVPANTGVVLEGSEGNYNIPVITNSGTSKGALQGNATNATAFNAVDGFTLYILTLVDNDKVQFNPCTSGEIAAGKAYLPVSKTQGAKALSVSFANDPTGIANVNATEAVQPVKRIVNRQLVIEKDGKRYNAIGTEY